MGRPLSRLLTTPSSFPSSRPELSLVCRYNSIFRPTNRCCLGALIAGDLADYFGRRPTIISGCIIYTIGVILQIASHGLGLLVAGRLIAGFGVGFVSAII